MLPDFDLDPFPKQCLTVIKSPYEPWFVPLPVESGFFFSIKQRSSVEWDTHKKKECNYRECFKHILFTSNSCCCAHSTHSPAVEESATVVFNKNQKKSRSLLINQAYSLYNTVLKQMVLT